MIALQKKHTAAFVCRNDKVKVSEINEEDGILNFLGTVPMENIYAFSKDITQNWQTLVEVNH